MVDTMEYTDEQIKLVLDRTVRIVPQAETCRIYDQVAKAFQQKFGIEEAKQAWALARGRSLALSPESQGGAGAAIATVPNMSRTANELYPQAGSTSTKCWPCQPK
ncbi:hypothetical protein ONZ43_g6424 [Nemania bipapillata]|uniref:Uncharacterized protein n=1 Tax=Nemania bipapillata TaxID=110536 RepID=A0ACC2I006_9PEZI|nr:hypothetical protein ONZ43_g6424 [Nemania bipapillata]